jgi:integrase
MVLTQAGLGLRIGELLALRAQDVNFLGRSVRVEHQLEERTREGVEPKTPRSRRTIPLPAFVGEALAEHIRHWPPLEDGSLFWGQNSRKPYDHAHYGTKILAKAVDKLARAEGLTFPSGSRRTTSGTTTRVCCWPVASRSWRSPSGSATRTRRWCSRCTGT